MKKPALIIGIVLFGLFISQTTTKRWWATYSHRFIPNTCMSLKDRMDLKIPKNWEITCPGTENLFLMVKVKNDNLVEQKLKQELYKILANSYVNFARLSNLETLRLLYHLTITIEHPRIRIVSKSDGESVARFANLKHQRDIATNLRSSVKVKEIIK